MVRSSGMVIVMACALVASLAGAGLAAADVEGQASQATVALSPASADIDTNATRAFDVVVSNVSGGIGSWTFTVSIDNTTVAEITNASDVNGNNPSPTANGSSVKFDTFGADTAQTGQVTIATVTISGQNAGLADLGLSITQLSDEQSGALYTVTNTTGATVNVSTAVAPPPVVGDKTPTDTDKDGKYDDVNGDGKTDTADAQAIFSKKNEKGVQNNKDKFDFNGDGNVNTADAQWLFINK